MLDLSDITASLKNTFDNDAVLQSLGFTPSRTLRGSYVNTNPNHTPWLGIYRTKVDYSPRALGRDCNGSWSGTMTIRLLVQASHIKSGADCEDRLEEYVKATLDAVWKDPTWNSVVDMVTAMNVEYSYKEDDTSTIYFQWAMITLSAEVSTE